jgi:hypothetical protein
MAAQTDIGNQLRELLIGASLAQLIGKKCCSMNWQERSANRRSYSAPEISAAKL